MWIAFANAEKDMEGGDLDLSGVGSLDDVPFGKYLPLIELLTRLDGVDLSGASGLEAAQLGGEAASATASAAEGVKNWNL